MSQSPSAGPTMPPVRLDLPSARRLRAGSGASIADYYLLFHCLVLAGIALAGRGFAYLGLSELSLILSCGVMLLCPVGLRRIFSLFPTVLVVPFVVWGALQTIPYLGQYRVLALRDAAQWGYMLWAFSIGAIIASRPARLSLLLDRYRRFSRLALVLLPVLYLLQSTGFNFPELPGSGMRIVTLKGGETLVHTGAIGAFLWIAPVAPLVLTARLFPFVFLVLFALGNRAGQVASVFQLGLAVLSRGLTMRVVSAAAVLIVPLAFLGVSGVKFQVGGREVSVEQQIEKSLSLIGLSSESRYENTREWRMNWWGDIINYTVYGPYFWTGKGFGINLADDDGYQLEASSALRSPHNSHLTVLARTGVPGLVLYVVLNLSWFFSMSFHAYLAWRARHTTWYRLFCWVTIFWSAIMVNACFDVVLEGPMASSWCWTLYGLGLAMMWIFRHTPESLPDYAAAHATAASAGPYPVRTGPMGRGA
jgi:hypothetical protein